MTKLELLREYLLKNGREGLCIAFSGGVDSALLLKVASQTLGERVFSVTFSSRLIPKTEAETAKRLAESFGVRHRTLQFDEFEDERILANPPDRCYYCKRFIFSKLLEFSRRNSLGRVADGTNADDLGQYRPGLRALRELNILSPLAACGFTKREVRQAAEELGIAVSNKPSAPCLATRIPYGTRLSAELLARVDAAEQYLKTLGFRVCRVRAHGLFARVEIPPREFGIFLLERAGIERALRDLGFAYITLDVKGFRSGSMDEVLPGFGPMHQARRLPEESSPAGGMQKCPGFGTAAAKEAERKNGLVTDEPFPAAAAGERAEDEEKKERPILDIEALLRDVKAGRVTVEDAAAKLQHMPYDDLGFARVDHNREARQGFPEVIFCQGKKPEQIAKIARNIAGAGENVLASRADAVAFSAVKALLPSAVYHEQARIIESMTHPVEKKGLIAVCTAGTSDIPVAEEAAVTAEAFGCNVTRIFDVGVAGIHRLFDRLEDIRKANVVIAVAGMEGALASVIGGLIDKPCIAVPTSVGYGANFGGLSALLTMLNSCSAGIGVMNIDNGFGAGVLAAQINRLAT